MLANNDRIKVLIPLILVVSSIILSFANANSHPSDINNTTGQKRMIVFGDSYSDNGNDYKLSHDQYPNSTAYYKGRFSDGPVWVEFFAKHFKINPNNPKTFLNYAYGQAKILAPTSITVYGTPDKQYAIPSFSEEIDAFEQQYMHFNPSDIVVVFISANDFFDISPTNTNDFFLKAADHQITQIQRLIQLGAEHIIVLNGRDVTLSPLAKIVARATTNSSDETVINNYLQQFRELIQLYNQQLTKQLSHNKAIIVYDVFKFDNKMLSNKSYQGNLKYQFDKEGMCYNNPQGDYQHVAGSICSNPDHYFYYDRIHTTRAVNEILADDVYHQVADRLYQ